ncbi:MAG: BREX-2 system phosphatase PglZ, partial [Mycobacterium leprae]
WLAGRAGRGEVVRAVLGCLAHPAYGPDTVAVGLAVAALTHVEAPPGAVTFAAVLGTRVFDRAIDPAAARGWGEAAEDLVQRLWGEQPVAAAAVCRRAEHVLIADAGAPAEFAEPSRVLPSALGLRLGGLADALGALLRRRTPSVADLRPVEEAARRVQEHAVAGRHEEQVRRAVMAVRLSRWLVRQRAAPLPPAAGLAEAARTQENDDAFVDVARARVWEGDVDPQVAAAYTSLCASVDAVRAGHEQRFAALLAEWTSTAPVDTALLPVEQVVDEVVGPLAAAQRVLLVVLDGMSTGVARELLADVGALGWVEHRLDPHRAVLSVLPSVTRVSRTSLFAGRLSDGTQASEKAAFADRGWPLFHKGKLTTAGAGQVFASEVIAAVEGPAAVVGVVLNSVDDTLAKGGRTPWTVASVDRLRELLDLADTARRVVLLTADHGHVHERGSRLEADDSGGARWRCTHRPAGPDEVELAGPRVLLGGGWIVAAWNETLRYGPKNNGYHGGASAQEVVVPLALLGRGPVPSPGWQPRFHPEPEWWVEEALTQATASAKPAARRKRTTAPPPEHDVLFGTAQLGADAWIADVLDSPVVSGQLARVRRIGVGRTHVERLLRLLDARGGSAPRAVVARALDTSDYRMNRMLATLQRVLNIDGYEVLTVEGETVRLNGALLKTQAGL